MIHKNILSMTLNELRNLHHNISNTPSAHGHELSKKPFIEWLDIVMNWKGKTILFDTTLIDLTGLK